MFFVARVCNWQPSIVAEVAVLTLSQFRLLNMYVTIPSNQFYGT